MSSIIAHWLAEEHGVSMTTEEKFTYFSPSAVYIEGTAPDQIAIITKKSFV
ncbi:MAG: hypothetical protein ACE3L7_02735 [Candidatus Pristimantibacillus sp.]